VRRSAVVGVFAVLFIGLSAVATAHARPSSPFDLDLTMAPKKVGSKGHPKAVRIDGRLRFEAKAEALVLTGGRLLVPRGIRLNHDRYPVCWRSFVEPPEPECSKRTVMGSSVGPRNPGQPTFGFLAKVDFVNGGPEGLRVFATYELPAFVQASFRVAVEPLRSPRWAYEVTFKVPEKLQMIGGTRMTVPDEFRWSIGGQAHARRYVVTNRGCPDRGYLPYRGNLTFRSPDDVTITSRYRGRLACR
jgi:hypothetical protein